ncbi:MAG: hypothetical protein CL676_02530 [Bdellovibrionaceae bacterium]|nr:hypothetical protein [Pseudobdellovibrionaceae bacterium]|tara:strand:- start:3262 stop:8139 length:4878 start_codon:yes stop_codon:yes gene_type:complete
MIEIVKINFSLSAIFKSVVLAFIVASLSSCGWLKDIAELEREVSFSVAINPGQIYEGQQAKVNVKLNKDYGEAKSISWKLIEDSSGNMATNTDFVETQGNLIISGTTAKEFTITSKPGSISSGSKAFKLIMTAQGVETEFDLSVLDSGNNNTISITSAENSGFVNISNQNSYTVSGVCSSSGSDVNLLAEISGQDTSGVIPCDSGLTWSIDLDFTGVTNEGAVTLTATHAGDGGTIASTTLQVTKDTIAPTTAITSPASLSYINASNASSFTTSGTCSDNGRVVTGTLSSSGGGTPVAVSSVCGSNTWSATANTTSLNDGTVTLNLDHADIAGNSISDNRSFNKDTLVPTFTITSPASMTMFNASNYNSLSISGTCNKASATMTLSGDVSGTLSTTCNGTNFSLSGLTLTGADGTRTITATLSDGAGNSTQANLNLQKDISVPTIAITSPAPSTIYNASNYTSLAMSGTCNEAGATVTLSGDVSGTLSTTCDGSNFSFSGLTLTGANGTRSITATIVDPGSNSSQDNISLEKDIAVPSINISSPNDFDVFNSSTYTSVSISGTCDKASATVTASGPVSGTLTTTCDGANFSLTGLTITGVDGSKNITLNISDSSGNSSGDSVTVVLDITLPVATLSGKPQSFDNDTNLDVTVGGTDVTQYLYKVGDSGSTDCSNATGYSSAINISTLITDAIGSDGSKRLCVRGQDSNGNIQDLASATSYDWTKDTVNPVVDYTSPASGSYVNGASQSNFVVSGTCSEVGSNNVSIAGDITPVQVDCVAGAPNTWSANVDFSGASEGPVFLLVSQTDQAGNLGSKTRAFVKDSVNPTIAFTSPAGGSYINNSNKASFTVSGTCDTYSATPNITLTGTSLTPASVACDGANWTANLAFNDGDEVVTVTATISDAAGNTNNNNRNFNKDTNNPVLAITSPSGGSYINDSNKASFAVSGTCSDDGTSNVAVSGDASATVNCSGNAWSTNLDFSAASDGAISITVTLTDQAGNTHAPSLALNKDVVAPSVNWTLPLALACASNSSGTSFEVSGTCNTADGDVTLSSAQLVPSVVTACTGDAWSETLNLDVSALSDLSTFSIQATQTDTAGNSASLARNFKKIGSTPTVVLGGWDDVYATGVKTYASNPGETTPGDEPGVVRINWKDWPASNTCMPEAVKVYRASSAGGVGSLVSSTQYPNGIPANIRTFTDDTLQGATSGTVGSPTDFAKGWYYTLKVTIAGNDYDVTSPASIAEVRVVAPPANMALMHRWIANQEVCGLMNRTTDETNHYRCGYSGWGKSAGNFYDLEQDLLVDRNEMACNFTAQCGAGGNQPCLASEFSTTNPQSAGIAGADGQVFYEDDGTLARCWVKISGTWYESNSGSASLTLADREIMSTNMAHKPPLVRTSQTRAWDVCQAHSVTLGQVSGFTTASKRLLRNKEWKAAAAWSPDLTDSQIHQTEYGGALGRCNTSNAHSSDPTDRQYVGTYAFYTGSQTSTNQCQSRYGLQDMTGNVWEWTSDQLDSCGASTCVGITSTLDTGNTDMNGFPFDHVTAPGNGLVNQWNIPTKSYGANYFNVPLGIPMISNDGGNAITIDDWLSPSDKFHNDYFSLYPTNGNVQRGLLVGGSWGNSSNGGRWAS